MKDFLKYMLATIAGILVLGFLSSLMMSVMMGMILAIGSTQSKTSVDKHSVYVIEMKGSVSEQVADDDYTQTLYEAMGRTAGKQYGLHDIIRNIRIAKDDDNIVGIYLRGGMLSAGFAAFSEIREALEDFRESGKFVVAYAENYGQGNYYLASVADKVYLNEQGSLGWSGLYSQLAYYSRALEKLGVEMQVVKVGTFKSAVEPYMRTDMSEANRLQMTTLLQDMWQVMLSDVSASRGISIDDLNRYADMNMQFQDEHLAAEYGLVDSIVYVQDMKDILEQFTGTEKYKLVSHSEMNSYASTVAPKENKDKIAVIYAEGDIVDDGDEGIVGKKMVKTINKVAKKDNVKAVVLRVNSPGGSAYASEQIWHALQLLKEEKPLVVSMGNYAASGGYYISCGADSIFAEANTLTGSIGIFGIIPNYSGLANKIGLDFDGVQTNRRGLMANNMVTKGMDAESRQLMQQVINRGYETFVGRCADGRQMTKDEIKAIAEGRVWSGSRALELNLVDAIGNLDDAIHSAAELVGLEDYSVVTFPEKKDRLTLFLESIFDSDSQDHILLREIKRIEKMAEKPAVYARLPYEIIIQ